MSTIRKLNIVVNLLHAFLFCLSFFDSPSLCVNACFNCARACMLSFILQLKALTLVLRFANKEAVIILHKRILAECQVMDELNPIIP